jgi:hypothetical protein
MDDPHSIHSQLESSAFPRDLYEVWFPSTVDAARFAQKALLAFEHGLRDLVVNAALSKPFTPDKRLTVEKITSFLKGK